MAELQARLAHWNTTTAGSIHIRPGDPAGNAWANHSDCWTPWEGKIVPPEPAAVSAEANGAVPNR